MDITRYAATFAVLALLVLGAACTAAEAQQSSAGSITGVVQTPAGVPVSGAVVNLRGPTSARTETDAQGAFSFTAVTPGIYAINVIKASYDSAARSDLVVVSGAPLNVSVVLQPVSFSSLRVIANVSTSTNPASTINTSTAAINVLPRSVFIDQGSQQVTQVLNQTPGIITTMGAFAISNGATMSTVQVPQIRGALPYETESLIDGHPVSVGALGYFTPLYVDPYFLQDVEVTKGPGAFPPDINYAIGGSVNYRTLEPTRATHTSLTFDLDSYGGLSTHVATTGTLGRLGYALGYGIVGTPGPLNNQTFLGTPTEIGNGLNPTIDGRPICGAGQGAGCLFSAQVGPTPISPTFGSLIYAFPVVTCCSPIDTTFQTRAELAKLNYNFSPETSLTAAFVGAQNFQSFPQTFSLDTAFFKPPAGYQGSIAAGAVVPYFLGTYQPNYNTITQGMFESELRTALGRSSLLFRYYTGANDSNNYNVPFGRPYTFTASTWGGLPLGPNGSTVFFNGQQASYSVTQAAYVAPTQDHFNGFSGEVDVPSGNNLLTFSADRTSHNSYAATYFEIPGISTVTIPHGSSQTFTTLLARGDFQLTPKLSMTFGNYFISYTSHFTADGGMTWQDASHSFYGPRLGLTLRPSNDTIYRFALGSSIAPPFVSLITTPSGAPVANNGGAPAFYTQTINNGNVNPETAFGFDLGLDRRLQLDTFLSADLYTTTLHGQFLNSVFLSGTYTPPAGVNKGLTRPLYISETLNLGTSRYEGIEFSIHKTPSLGLGYRLQGSLMRAYAYNLPPGFYDTASGPNTTNLAVIPNINFQPSGNGYNGLSNGRVPYSMGYAEFNYRTPHAYYLMGLTYFGNNNTYNQPAFEVVNASARWQLGKQTSLQLTAYNVLDSYGTRFFSLFGGIPVPLVNGLQGATAGINVGPTTFQLILHQDLGT
jgi:outer membrane receptor protein involved in Fe transport